MPPLPSARRSTRAAVTLGLTGCALLALLAAPASGPRAASRDEVSVSVATAYPIGKRGDQPIGFLSGRALAGLEDQDRLDVVFVLDASGVTGASSGVDIDGDGRISGSPGRFGPDSILAAEIQAVEALLDELDDRTTRVGVVAYAGGAAGSADDAWVQVPLTSDYADARSRMRKMLEYHTPQGSSDMPAGVRLARIELIEGRERNAPRAHRRIVLLSEGYPETPRESQLRTEQRIVAMARRCRSQGIRIHSYAIGPLALERPRAAIEIARHSRGAYVPVDDHEELRNVLPRIDLAQIKKLEVTHVATGEPALETLRTPDGRYSALVPLRPGQNEVEVYVRSSNGAERRVRVEISADRPRDPRDALDLARLKRRLAPDVRRELVVEIPEDPDAAGVGAGDATAPEERREIRVETLEEPSDPPQTE